MNLTIVYRGQLAGAAGHAEEEVPCEDGASFADLVRARAGALGPVFTGLVCEDDGRLRRTLLVAADGDQVVDPESPVPSGVREVTLIPPIAGG